MTYNDSRNMYRRKLLKTVGIGLAAVAVGSQAVSANEGQTPAVEPGQKPTDEQFGAYWGGPWGGTWRGYYRGYGYDPCCGVGGSFYRPYGYRGYGLRGYGIRGRAPFYGGFGSRGGYYRLSGSPNWRYRVY
ncbi:hypothetical protein [Haloarchaeobius sp. HME9146]|uniref:hypothetical protein n=1 Tax=Haloarchaeobius sp. HME9146 TaxID=2978732 RepID=UPI0021BE9092|nr:hypothetical protein [Haloarchaeobius sp. HME9146]MCT9098353.1 hypothetical protein [Haloarchaeobius sp. HME9146]